MSMEINASYPEKTRVIKFFIFVIVNIDILHFFIIYKVKKLFSKRQDDLFNYFLMFAYFSMEFIIEKIFYFICGNDSSIQSKQEVKLNQGKIRVCIES